MGCHPPWARPPKAGIALPDGPVRQVVWDPPWVAELLQLPLGAGAAEVVVEAVVGEEGPWEETSL